MLRGNKINVRLFNAHRHEVGRPNIYLTEDILIQANKTREMARIGRLWTNRIILFTLVNIIAAWFIDRHVALLVISICVVAAIVSAVRATVLEWTIPNSVPKLSYFAGTVEIYLRSGDFIGLRVGLELTKWKYAPQHQ